MDSPLAGNARPEKALWYQEVLSLDPDSRIFLPYARLLARLGRRSEAVDVLKAGLEHEEYVTSLINDIYAAAYDVKDFRTMQFLDWFVKEQGEEETNANDMITKMELFGSDPRSLYLLNQELATRVYSAPSLVL